MADLVRMSDRFEGLPMESLIGGPLEAAARAQVNLARGTADFIKAVGFHADDSVRSIDFKYEATDQRDDGTPYLKEVTVTVPMLAVVPIPNLQIDTVDVTFDMQVKESVVEQTESKAGSSSTRETEERVKVYGETASHRENTRSTDNSAKYHVEVHASNHGMPEGLQRVIDMMASSVAPRKIVAYDLNEKTGERKPGQGKVITNPNTRV